MSPRFKKHVGRMLIFTWLLSSFAGCAPMFVSAKAQKKIIVVNAEQPNLWTLEQAHYLLAQMHRRNLDLKAKSLEDLDPNEIAGLRFDVMRMLIEFGATFNQADLEANRLFSANRTFNAERRQELLARRDRLSDESLRLAGEIEGLEIEKASTDDRDARSRIDARIAAKNTRLAKVDKENEIVNGELGTLTAPSGTPTVTTGAAAFNAEKLPKSTFDKAFEEAAKKQIERFSDSPKLNASLRLDNFLQMQYEIISKQLSLLRDELGPGERLVFLELPQTVNAAHHESNRKWAQSWWKIVGYTRRERVAATPTATPSPMPRPSSDQPPITTTQDVNSTLYGDTFPVRVEPLCNSSTTDTYRNSQIIRINDRPTPLPARTPTPQSRRTRPPAPAPTPEPGKASAYPSVIEVSAPGSVTKVTVTLHNLNHPRPDDVDILLVGPEGQNAVIWSDVGGTTPANGITITLDDAAATDPLPDNGPFVNNRSYQPTDIPDGPDSFPEDAPRPLGGSALAVFNGTNPNGQWKLYLIDDSADFAGIINVGWSLTITTTKNCPPPRPALEDRYRDVFVELDATPTPSPAPLGNFMRRSDENPSPPMLENRIVRTIELIPRQNSLNVNDMNLQVKAGALNFVLSTLFGFGSQLSVQRQREQFSQFVQQELYSAAFGKGAREFGWTFTPMPGTERLHSGVRTTYAVLVVPEEAASLVLEANGCYFPRSFYPPRNFDDTKTEEWNNSERTSRNCGRPTKAFVVPIPKARVDGRNEFWVEKIEFQPVGKGQRVVVAVSGKHFSPQIGVLINGVPLVQSIGLAQPLIRDESAAGRATADELRDAEITGWIERIDSNKVVFSFKMPPDFTGTPTITLIAPGRARDINTLPRVDVNDESDTSLAEYSKKMFGHSPGPDPFRIDKVRVFRNGNPKKLTALVSGEGFLDRGGNTVIAKLLVNGVSLTPKAPESATLLSLDFDTPKDDTIKVMMVSNKMATIESDAVANPAFLSIGDVEVTSYEPAAEGEPATLLVRIRGTGFTDSLRAFVNRKSLDVAVKSATEAVFTMPDPKAAAVVTLEDGTGQKAKIVVTRLTAPQR